MTDNPTCPKCGCVLAIGSWPFCPHGQTVGYSNFRDEIPGGWVGDNYGPKPITFYSHSERRRYMAAHGLREKEKFCPMPGTDKDPQGIPNPAGYMDAQTRENAIALITRQQLCGKTEDETKTEGVLTGFTVGTLTNRDAAAIASGDPRRASRLHRRTSGSHPSS